MPPTVFLHHLKPLPEAAPIPSPRSFARVLGRAGAAAGELNLVLTDATELRRLNRAFRGKDRTTDVLAFQYDPPEPREEARQREVWGDVYVSADAALAQARERGISPREELARLFLHGCLHLLGHRDETSRARARMERVQEALLAALLGRRAVPRA